MRIRTGPIIGFVGERSALVWLEWLKHESAPALVLESGETVAAESSPTHRSAGTYGLRKLAPDTVYSFRFDPPDPQRPGPFSLQTVAPVPTDGAFAIVSCNQWQRYRVNPPAGSRIWEDLHSQLRARKIRAVLHVGDQIYADEVWDAITNADLERKARRPTPPAEQERWCRQNRPYWEEAYRNLYRETWNPHHSLAGVLSNVSNMMMRDDHDIHDGYGSRPTDFWLPHNRVAEVARQVYREYQHALNPPGSVLARNALPWAIRWPGIELFALDLRSERRYDTNPSRVVGPEQWKALSAWKDGRSPHDPRDPDSFGAISFIVASTPPVLFGNTDSAGYVLVPDLIDDLRDQWIHGANRRDLGTLLRFCDDLAREKRTRVVILSGDIHIHHLVRCVRKNDQSLLLYQVTSSPVGNAPVTGILRDLIYAHVSLQGPTHRNSPYEGAIVDGTLIGQRGYAIVSWEWGTDDVPRLAATWRVINSDNEIVEKGPFFLS